MPVRLFERKISGEKTASHRNGCNFCERQGAGADNPGGYPSPATQYFTNECAAAAIKSLSESVQRGCALHWRRLSADFFDVCEQPVDHARQKAPYRARVYLAAVFAELLPVGSNRYDGIAVDLHLLFSGRGFPAAGGRDRRRCFFSRRLLLMDPFYDILFREAPTEQNP